jgi:hypothetical protein
MSKEKFISYDKPEFIYDEDNFSKSINNFNYIDSKDKKSKEIDFNFFNKNQFNGKRFQNINILNDIMKSNNSRKDSREYKENKESLQMFDYNFRYIFGEYKNHVMELPRGGIMTRKNNNVSNILFNY